MKQKIHQQFFGSLIVLPGTVTRKRERKQSLEKGDFEHWRRVLPFLVLSFLKPFSLSLSPQSWGASVYRKVFKDEVPVFDYMQRFSLPFITVYMLVLIAQSCPTLCDPMDPARLLCPFFLQARILERVVIPLSSQCTMKRKRKNIKQALPKVFPGKFGSSYI